MSTWRDRERDERMACRARLLKRYRQLTERLEEVEDALYVPEKLTASEHEDLCQERRNLFIFLDQVESDINYEFHTIEFDKLLTQYNI